MQCRCIMKDKPTYYDMVCEECKKKNDRAEEGSDDD